MGIIIDGGSVPEEHDLMDIFELGPRVYSVCGNEPTERQRRHGRELSYAERTEALGYASGRREMVRNILRAAETSTERLREVLREEIMPIRNRETHYTRAFWTVGAADKARILRSVRVPDEKYAREIVQYLE